MPPVIAVTMPVSPAIQLAEFANFKVGAKHRSATILYITLLSSFRTPFYCEVKVTAIDEAALTFHKIFKFNYSVLNTSGDTAMLDLAEIKDTAADAETWYKLDTNLARNVLGAGGDPA